MSLGLGGGYFGHEAKLNDLTVLVKLNVSEDGSEMIGLCERSLDQMSNCED